VIPLPPLVRLVYEVFDDVSEGRSAARVLGDQDFEAPSVLGAEPGVELSIATLVRAVGRRLITCLVTHHPPPKQYACPVGLAIC